MLTTLVYLETADDTLEIYRDDETGHAVIYNTNLEDPDDQGCATIRAEHLRAAAFALLALAGDRVRLV